MMTLPEFEAELDSATVDLENLAAKAPPPFKEQMQPALTMLREIYERVSKAVDEEQP